MSTVDLIPLNGPQRLHFEVVLASLEKALSRLELIAQGNEHAGCRLTRMDGDLPEAFWEGAAPIIENLRAHVVSLSNAMALTERHTSAKRLVRTLLTAQLLKIEDSSSGRLRGYGAVDPAVEGRLDPALEALQLDLHAVLDLLSQSVPGDQRSGSR